jgi:nucleotide-binding universal stress UspA family protein
MVKRILVGLGDLDYSAAATQRAVLIAQQQGAQLTGITLLDVKRLENVGPVPLGGGAAAQELREHRLREAREAIQQAAQRFQETCAQAGVPATLIHEERDPIQGIVHQARYQDLVVVGLRCFFEHDLIDQPDNELLKLIEGGVRPLLAVSLDVRPIQRVLIAYSGSTESAKAMRNYVKLRLWPEALLKIITFGSGDEPLRLLSDAAAYCQAHGFQPETQCIDESPKDGLLRQADLWNADLIVVGNSAKNFWRRRILGETAMHVMQHSQRSLYLSQ